MTRHRRRPPRRLIDPARSLTIAVFIVAVLGGLLAAPAGRPAGETDFLSREGLPSITAAPSPDADADRPGRRGDLTSRPDPTGDPGATHTPTSSPTPSADPSKSSAPTPDRRTHVEDEVTRLTNAERAKAGCDPLRTDERLRRAARGHSDDMASRQYFSHTSPDGETPWERAEAEGYPSPSAENIAHGYPDAKAVVAAWMASEGHRANILSCKSKATGVGVALNGAGAPYWTQMFGYE